MCISYVVCERNFYSKVYFIVICDTNEKNEKEKYFESFELVQIVIQSAFVNVQNIKKKFFTCNKILR